MFTLNCKGRLLVANRPLVMGVINTTPDSFYSASRFNGIDSQLLAAETMLNQGASILDIGGQSSRPGAPSVVEEEELRRVITPVVEISKRFPEAILSIDTYRAPVAEQAVAAGACIVNDIGAGNLDSRMMDTVSRLRVPYLCMHMRGTPQTMQQLTHYDDLWKNLIDFFVSIKEQCRRAGIVDLIVDPGFGFSKTSEQNLQIIAGLERLKILGCPVLVGVSRKSTIYKLLEVSADDALNGTTVLNTISLLKGADILRVHDVREAVQAVKIVGELRKSSKLTETVSG